MNKIIRVEPVNRVFSITWNLGPRCNYDCMYCPSRYHDSTSPHKDLEYLKNCWIDIVSKTQSKNLKYKISFTGGEVTGNKDLMPFLKWLNENYRDRIDKLLLATNGSATYKYYKKLIELVDNVTFSVHSEFINEKKFFDCVIKLHSELPVDKHIHVTIMDEAWNAERIKMYCKILSSHNISYMVNKINYSNQIRSYPVMKGKFNLANT